MYSTCKLNKQGDNIEPCCTPFPILTQSVFPCFVLTVASWTAYRFFRRQLMWSGILFSLRILQFVGIHTVKGFSIVLEAEVNIFFWNSLASLMIQQMLRIWYLPLWFLCLFRILLVHMEVFSSQTTEAQLERFLTITLLPCEMSTTASSYFEHSLALPFGIDMKTDLFQSCGHC